MAIVSTQKKKKAKGRGSTVELSATTYAAVGKIKERTGDPINKIAERTMSWLASMDEDVQGTIIGSLPRSRRADFIREILLATAEGDERAEDLADAGEVVDEATDRSKRQTKSQRKKRRKKKQPK